MTFSARLRRWLDPYRSAKTRYCGSAIGAVRAEIDPHALYLEVLPDAREAALAAKARSLVTAERGLRHRVAIGVHPHGPGLHLACHPVRPGDVLVQTPAARPNGTSLARSIASCSDS